MVAPADKPGREPKGGKDPEVLAERRARRAELAEGELRARLADAEQRVAQLEHGAHEASRLRERLAARADRDGRMAALVADAATTLRAAREALDREIAARGVLEAALHAERAAREAAEQAVVAERAARDAATSALTAERARVVPIPVFAPPQPPAAAEAPAPASPTPLQPVPAEETQATAPVTLDNEQLIAGLALAAERLREQVPVVEEAPAGQAAEQPVESVQEPAVKPVEQPVAEPVAEPAAEPVAESMPAAVIAPAKDPEFADPAEAIQPVADPPADPADEPWTPRPGGLVERIGRALRRRG